MSAARMQAWRAHAYGAVAAELRLESARVPAVRAPDDVLVRVLAASVNPLDAAMLGGYGARVLGALRGLAGGDEFPLVLGRDCCGEVVAAGAAARLRRGQRVWAAVPPHRPGAHAQYVLLKDRWAGPAPRTLGALEAGGAPYAALSAAAALRAAGLPLGVPARGRVLLLGLGGVGQAALQLLAHAGAEVAVGCSPELFPLAEALGAARTLDRSGADYDRQLEEGGPYRAVLDCAGLGGAEAGARRWRFARYVTLSSPLLRLTDGGGLAAGALRAGAALLAQNAAATRAALPGAGPAGAGPAGAWPAGAGPAGAWPAGAWPAGAALPVRWAFFAPAAGELELVRRLAERGRFSVAVQRAYPWWAAPRAYERQAGGHARGKLLLDWTAERAPGAAADCFEK